MKIGDWEIELSWPTSKAVGKCLQNRADLLGSVKATLNGKCCSARLPLPYEGVFLVRSYEHDNLERLVWNARLLPDVEVDDGKHGVRKIPSGKKLYAFWNFLEQVLKKRIAAAENDAAKLDLEGLVPIRWLQKKGFLQRVRPQNPLELLASINGVRRYAVPREIAARYGIDRRLNQGEGMAFEGRICPIETPESELVGIQLQLARGARVCSDGTVEPAQSDRFLDRLGWGAALIPFVNYNDSARNTVGAKNLRQALVVEGREAPLVQTGAERELVKRMKPLMDAGVCPSALDGKGELALGCNLLVAYMPWFGWNIEDAMVVSESAARKLCVYDENGDPLPLKLGDKLTGRHGNKGVVSRILPDAEMPHLPTGEAVEIILNPHGIISRMNPGQLLETHLGWLYHAGVQENEVMKDGAPQHKEIRELLARHGLDDRGRVKVSLPGVGRTENPVVVGYQYFVRLNHIPSKVAHADRTQHIGEMEVWTLAANEANVLLGEMLGDSFAREFRDWLLVLGIGMERTDGGVKFKYLDDGELMSAMQDSLGVAPREVAVKGKDAGYEEICSVRYQCRNPECDYRTDAIYASGGKLLKMDDFLRGLGFFGNAGQTITHKPDTGTYRLTCKLPDGRELVGYCQRRGKDGASPKLGEFDACCPRHATMKLIRSGEVEGRKLWPRPGGLFDAAIFPSKDHWGYISLKKPGPGGRKIVPVLPLKYRRMLVEGRMDDLSAAYADILDAREGWGLQTALGGLEALVKERLFGLRRQPTRKRGADKTVELGKKGLVRRHGLGRDVVHAARQVIVPNPELEWNEVGVPRKVYQAIRDGNLPAQDNVLVLNRQPSLHRYSMQALHPKVMEGDEDVFQISPLVCGGFAADFDGDAMVAHCPISDKAQKDACKMLPENNLRSTANGASMVHFKLDFKSGTHLLGKKLKDIEEWYDNPKAVVGKLSQFARQAFAAVTRNGASFGFYDFLDRKSGVESAALKLIYDDSGANGNPEQMNAILERFVEGMDWKEFFRQSDEGRRRICGKKLNSGKAGGLTRRLVLELWPRRGVEGLRAAQAIGERALQLTQSSVHGGEVDVDGLRKMLLCRGRKLDRSTLPQELECLLHGNTFDVWDEVFASDDKPPADAMTRLAAGRDQFRIIEELAKTGEEVKFDSPFGKVLFNAN